jgi:hypothetical protein
MRRRAADGNLIEAILKRCPRGGIRWLCNVVQHLVRRFVIKEGVPTPAVEFTVEAGSLDAARAAARALLEADGHRIRALTFGPTGLVAYVEERST